ncbi:MAG TPA: cytochrome c biogenesis protein CcdA [Bryobacteraceae bacterium]|nr:cytochrome c biogenesis protein CcdA [Bryobacteraceae bacterium]
MKAIVVSCALLLAAAEFCVEPSLAAEPSHAGWTLSTAAAKVPPGATVPLRLTAKIDSGWHIYSLTTPKGGGQPGKITPAPGAPAESFQIYQPKPDVKFDPNFGVDVETFSNQVTFLIPTKLKGDTPSGSLDFTEQLHYQVCSDTQCVNQKKTVSTALDIDPAAPAPPAFLVPAGYTEAKPGQVDPSGPPPAPESSGLGAFVLTAFGVGLLSIFTPCVFPMIPITVSFFLKQKGGIAQAVLFSLGIVVLFCALGLGVTAAVGPFGVEQLAANPWVNGFIALVFAAFAFSLLGAFEITLPSSFLTRLDKASRRGGYAGTLLMGLTFSLTSFACVGPFVGSLLAASVQGQGSEPVLGMLSFATGLASPFFFLAAFPSYLERLPKSGAWLARVKVVMGFVLLALVFKYLSNIDEALQIGFLTRERFLAAWFVLFALAGVYLLGLLRLDGMEPGEHLGISRLLIASAFLIFAFSLLPGMFGGRLGDLDAYIPAPASGPNLTSGILGGVLGAGARPGPVWLKNDYRQALDLARQQNKLVLVNFTGYTCTNCKWMEANMFPKPEIAGALQNLVLVDLYTDGNDAAADENQKIEQDKFKTVAVPFYALVDANENVVNTFGSLTKDPQKFLAFLQSRPGA